MAQDQDLCGPHRWPPYPAQAGTAPELAHHDHIQRRAERPGNLKSHRDAAPRQAKHHNPLPPQMLQPRRQLPSRIGAIAKRTAPLLPVSPLRKIRLLPAGATHQGR